MGGASSHAGNVILGRNQLIWIFNDNDAPTRDAIEIFDVITEIANVPRIKRVTKIAATSIMNG